MKAKEIKTIEDLKVYLHQIGAQIFVVADYPERNAFECVVYDKNNKNCKVKIHIRDVRHKDGSKTEYWYINGWKADRTFWKFDKDICCTKEEIAKVCWRLSRRVRA